MAYGYAYIEQIFSPTRRRTVSAITLLCCLCFGLILLTYSGRAGGSAVGLPDLVKPGRWRKRVDYDIVMSYYNEDLDTLNNTVQTVVGSLPASSSHSVTIYIKGEMDRDKRGFLEKVADEVVPLKNVGREGETYLYHIVRHYITGEKDLGDLTIFIQPHIAWDWVMLPRLATLTGTFFDPQPDARLGFMSLGPYVSQTAGKDSSGNEFPRMTDIYAMFRHDLSPPHAVLATWAGQFVVSRKRILDNPLDTYQNLLAKFHAPPEHWIWKEGWWNNEPSNPTLGHALERTWPVIFDCTDATMAEECGEKAGPGCQCLDS